MTLFCVTGILKDNSVGHKFEARSNLCWEANSTKKEINDFANEPLDGHAKRKATF